MSEMKWSNAFIPFALLCCAGTLAQEWIPRRNVEIVVSSVPGGSNDKTARAVERILVTNKLIPASVTVVNKAGSGGNLAFAYLAQHAGDPHYLLIGTPGLVIGQLVGYTQFRHTDFTPIASLVNDYTVFAVNAASSFRTGRDLVDRLLKDPKSVALGVGGAVGGLQTIPAGLLMKAAGGNARDLKVVAFKGSAESVTNLMGGHIDLVTTAAGNAVDHHMSGKLRVLAVAAPQRFGAELSGVPTRREQGFDVVFGAWRAIVGPRGLSAPHVAYWEAVLRKVTEYPEWKADLEKHYWSDYFTPSAPFRKHLDQEYAETKAVLVDLGLARP
jgi:putative tricarboxylic transport membrane protein